MIQMAKCENCGSHVTEQYVRVFVPDDGQPECCPSCPGMIRDPSGQPREKKG